MNTRSDNLYVSIPGDSYTPFSLAKKLGAKAILESASFSQGKARYSILMLDEAFRVLQDSNGVFVVIDGVRVRYVSESKLSDLDILDVLAEIAVQNKLPSQNIPLPAAGIGFLGYEFAARCDTIHFSAQNDELEIPESEFMVGHVYLVFDHFTETIHIFAQNYKEHEIDLKKAIQKVQERLNDMDFSYLAKANTENSFEIVTDLEESKLQYLDKVKTLQKHIVDGDIIQAVPSRRLFVESNVEALELYRRLRSINPSPYLFYLDFVDYQLIGASPESIVKVQDGVASIRPIAGTRRRGKDEEEDFVLKKELLKDPKERAEHLMLVDLARNDLGRVCEAGSVKLIKNMESEVFSHVIHLVSDVNGKVQNNKRPIDVLRSVFPAGTVSGAPKINAIEILSKLEANKRGFYAGAVGYIKANGDLDFCISIRTTLKKGNRWVLQAGGGIVYASDPEREWEETNEKLGAMLTVLKGVEK
ncbi:MAG: anthranilate synthase component I [Fibrobacter sp.]|nr:anthranilate synthase component I [Fibrobacter sp.]